MKLQNHTILITGGSTGIGLELAKVLTEKGNTVLICGRSQEKLIEAKKQIPKLQILACDLSDKVDRDKLVKWVKTEFPQCNILINNAGITHNTNFKGDDEILVKAEQEIQLNLMAPIVLTKQLLPVLEQNPNPTIINVTTGLAYVPKAAYPIYNATKAALHSFTMVLRKQLEHDPIDIIEVLMTVVDTPFHNGHAPKRAISPQKAVCEMIQKLEKGKKEIRIDKVGLLYMISRLSPKLAFRMINRVG